MTKRKVILYIATSLDGYIADNKGGIEWLSTNAVDNQPDTSYENFYKTIDTVIMGRTTFDQVTTELSPDDYPYADSTSYVLTSREGIQRENVIYTSENVSTLVSNLKNQSGGDIFIVGGASIVQPLIKENLIDEYQLAIIPTLLGEGTSLFGKLDSSVELTAVSAKVVNNIVYHTYLKK
ncbi:dihydrofolate reductase family protein [Vagococcus sp.]|uniref:dihydrofolate reductase family protein n=1 Tax=Vagococcus sp. TaxID=1933889 RepID=UPI002FC7FF89